MLERTSPFQIVTNKMKKNSGRKWMEKRNKGREMARFVMYYSNRIASIVASCISIHLYAE